MFGPAHGLVLHPPYPVSETQGEQQEENAHDLQKDDVSHAVEWLEESAHSPSYGAGDNPRPARGLSSGPCPSGRAFKGHRPGGWPALRGPGCGLSAGRNVLAGHPAHHPHSDPQDPADSLRFHIRLSWYQWRCPPGFCIYLLYAVVLTSQWT